MNDATLSLQDMDAAVGERRARAPVTDSVSGVDQQLAAYLASRERERQRKRGVIRADIARREGLMAELALLDDQLRQLDARADAAAEQHARTAEPIQVALASASGDKRAKLLGELTDANVQLERELDTLRRVRSPLVKKREATNKELAGCRTEAFLTGADVADPRLLSEAFAANRRLEAAQSRAKRAESMLQDIRPLLRGLKTTKVRPTSHGWQASNQPPNYDYTWLAHLLRRERDWQCELTHASQELHASQEALDEITREMCNE